MATLHAFRRRRREIVDDHQHLAELLRGLVCAGLSPVTMRTRLGDVRVVLNRHFAREEGVDGLFEIIRSKAPDRCLAVAALKDQHRHLLGELDELAGRHDCALHPELVEEFVARLREHEKAESRLLIRVLETSCA